MRGDTVAGDATLDGIGGHAGEVDAEQVGKAARPANDATRTAAGSGVADPGRGSNDVFGDDATPGPGSPHGAQRHAEFSGRPARFGEAASRPPAWTTGGGRRGGGANRRGAAAAGRAAAGAAATGAGSAARSGGVSPSPSSSPISWPHRNTSPGRRSDGGGRCQGPTWSGLSVSMSRYRFFASTGASSSTSHWMIGASLHGEAKLGHRDLNRHGVPPRQVRRTRSEHRTSAASRRIGGPWRHRSPAARRCAPSR